MIKFFRKIRQKLLSENKFSKYLIYAIGEILLVVIGILIALQINNWNENRKTQAKNYQLLLKVHEELAFNIERSNSLLRTYRTKERDFSRVLKKEVTLKDYQTSSLSNLVLSHNVLNISDDDANNLKAFDININSKQDSLVSRISELYKIFTPFLKRNDERINNIIFKFAAKLDDTKDWAHLRISGTLNDEAYNYFLNDPLYLNEVAAYQRSGLGTHHRTNYHFNRTAKSIYLDLSDFLDLEVDTTIVGTLENNRHYIGTYTYQDNIIEVKQQGNRLVYILKHEGEDTYDFHPENDSIFMLDVNFGKLVINEKQKISGMVLSRGTILEPTEYKKIE